MTQKTEGFFILSTIDAHPAQSQEFSDFSPSPKGGLILYRTTQQNLECSAPNRPLLKAVSIDQKTVVFFHPRCKQWSCPACGQKNAYKAVLRAFQGSEGFRDGGAPLHFLTVTSHEKLSAAASLAVLPKAWNKLNVRIKRAAAAPEYFAIPEQHKNGRWHLHAIITANLPRKWWKNNARECGLGYQSDVREVKQLGGVPYYIAKYVTKALENAALPKGFRRIRTSSGWPKLESPQPLEGWEFLIVPRENSLQSEVERYQKTGNTVVLADEISSWDWMKNWA